MPPTSHPIPPLPSPPPREAGQTTAEYALVLLGVAAVALAFITWASGGHIAQFLDTVFERLVATGK